MKTGIGIILMVVSILSPFEGAREGFYA